MSNVREQWKIIKSHPDYSVSNKGRVRRNRDGYQMGLSYTRDGYIKTNLGKEGPGRTQRVHRLVCQAFHGDPPSELHICHHKNHRKNDNRAANLEWVTQLENVRLSASFRGGQQPHVSNHQIMKELKQLKQLIRRLVDE